MKLSKDQKQKLMLGGMMVIGVIYGFIEFLISPAQNARAAALKNIGTIQPKIDAAKAQIAKTNGLEAKLPETSKFNAQVAAMIPEGSPVAWFPPRVADYFKQQGIDKVSARANSDTVEKELTGYKRYNWGVEIPRAEFIALGTALAEMENGEPLLEIQAIDIEANRDDAQAQRANLTINTLVRQ
jgi:hypothetical protein